MNRIPAPSKARRRHIKTNNQESSKLNSKTQVQWRRLSSRVNPSPINSNLRAAKIKGIMTKAILIRLTLSHVNLVGVIAKEVTVIERNPCKKSSNHDF